MPIGNLTSQFWANVYLDPLDQFVKRRLRCRGYLRYVDDNARRGHYARRHLRTLAAAAAAGQIPLTCLSASVLGWAAHAAHGDTYGLRRDVLSRIRA